MTLNKRSLVQISTKARGAAPASKLKTQFIQFIKAMNDRCSLLPWFQREAYLLQNSAKLCSKRCFCLGRHLDC